MDKNTLRRADLVTSIVLMLVSVFGFIMSFSLFLQTLGKNKYWYESAGLFPMVITFFLGLCGLLLFLRARKDGAKFDFITIGHLKRLIILREFKVALIVITLLAIYIFILIPLLPYAIATFIYLFTFIFIFKEKNLKSFIITTIVSVIAAALLTYGFGNLAMIPLP